VVLAVGKGKGGAASHADVRVGPFWGLRLMLACFGMPCGSEGTHCAAVEHVARDVLLWREVEAFALQTVVDVVDVAQVAAALGGDGPGLDELEHLVLDIVVGGDVGRGLEERRQVVHELARCDLLDEVGAAVLDACIGEIEGGELDVRVLVTDALLQRAHGLFRLHCLGADYIGDVEVEGHVLSIWGQSGGDAWAEEMRGCIQARGGGALDLLVERAVGRGPKPARHGGQDVDRGGRCRQTRVGEEEEDNEAERGRRDRAGQGLSLYGVRQRVHRTLGWGVLLGGGRCKGKGG
jgi:hypothetical protein